MISKQDFPNINERPPEGKKPDGTPYKILVVDDSIFVTKQAMKLLLRLLTDLRALKNIKSYVPMLTS